ncbi:uncharacterized protein [Montipora foliosa]|uniref:uncharacterized protein n=1 Tax=Montipora foliosa TaxID=591990 RepID=UPI0035F10C2A
MSTLNVPLRSDTNFPLETKPDFLFFSVERHGILLVNGGHFIREWAKPGLFYLPVILDPCASGSYQTINSSDRLVGNTDQGSLKCDKHNLIPGWYRFTGDAGDKIPNTRPPHTRRCGTHAPGWISGSNPGVADGEVTRTVCYFWSGNDCRWSNSIKVKNCGAFYVYELQKPPFCWLRYCEASECANYTTLDQADRAVGNTNQSNFKCDRWDPGKIVSHDWYRMTGASGDQIPEGCVPINRCGTRAPGWLNDTHPTVKDGLQSAQVCYHWNNDCCKWKNNITIRNCGSYFVYQLVKPPDCRLRYCALDPCRSGNYQIINSSDRLVGNTDKSSFKCDKHDLIPGWYRFTGDAGDKIPNTRPSHTHLCGTHAPGWISGGNPTVADGEVTRSVCYFWSGNDCRWNNSIKVRNCGAFYVYKLQKPPVCWLRYCGDECTNYTIIDQADRAVSNTNPSNSKCDRWYPDKIVSHDWYRMTGNSGDQIPERCVPMNRCGTHAPGWLNDTHPTVKDGLQRAQVCYHWNNDCCKWKNNITIRNCGSYFVYQLVKPPVCHLRYCGNGNALSTTPPGITKPALDPCTSGNYQTINSSDRLVGNTDQSSSKCDSHDLIPGWYRFAGDAGDGMPTYCPPTRRCGTDAPGWLNGSYPTMVEGVVNRKLLLIPLSRNNCAGHNFVVHNSAIRKNCAAHEYVVHNSDIRNNHAAHNFVFLNSAIRNNYTAHSYVVHNSAIRNNYTTHNYIVPDSVIRNNYTTYNNIVHESAIRNDYTNQNHIVHDSAIR